MRLLVRLLVVLVVAAGVLAAALYGLTRQFTAHGADMAPAVRNGDQVGVFRFSGWFYTPHRKDVVVFAAPALAAERCRESGHLVRRVIGLPGETVTERAGAVSIDGTPLREPYVAPGRRDSRSGSWHVPPGEYFVLGDNRKTACDSRTFGAVPKKSIVGRVVLTYWPIARVSIG